MCQLAMTASFMCVHDQALGSALLYVTSGAAVSVSVALSLLAGTLYALVFLAASAGTTAGSACMHAHGQRHCGAVYVVAVPPACSTTTRRWQNLP